jgi:hypothetical protein
MTAGHCSGQPGWDDQGRTAMTVVDRAALTGRTGQDRENRTART